MPPLIHMAKPLVSPQSLGQHPSARAQLLPERGTWGSAAFWLRDLSAGPITTASCALKPHPECRIEQSG